MSPSASPASPSPPFPPLLTDAGEPGVFSQSSPHSVALWALICRTPQALGADFRGSLPALTGAVGVGNSSVLKQNRSKELSHRPGP